MKSQSDRSFTKYLLLALFLKACLFVFFAWQFTRHYPQEQILQNLFVISGDTQGYYGPNEDFVQGKGYTSVCRMPGLLPIYVPLRLLFTETGTKLAIIFLQFIAGALSVVLLAYLAQLAFPAFKLFRITFYTYALSSFVSIWDHYGYSDSFAVSFMINSLYFLYRFREKGNKWLLLLAGIFLTWSIFFRPVHGAIVPVYLLFLFLGRTQRAILAKNILTFLLPLMLAITGWTARNYKITGEFIPLQASLEKCYPSIPPEMSAIRKLIIAWGGDILAWSKGSAGMWFFNPSSTGKSEDLLENREHTTAYNSDSLKNLRAAYLRFRTTGISHSEREQLSRYIFSRSAVYIHSYKKEKPVRFYILNRLRLVKTFLFPPRLDYLPFPPLQHMQFYHKIVKLGYLILLYLVSFFGLAGAILSLSKKNIFSLFPFTLIISLAWVMGYVELRYLTPVYPLMLVFALYFVFAATAIRKDSFSPLPPPPPQR